MHLSILSSVHSDICLPSSAHTPILQCITYIASIDPFIIRLPLIIPYVYLLSTHPSLCPSTFQSSTHLLFNLLIYHPPSIHIHPSFYQSAYYHLSILLCIHLTLCPFTDLSSTHPVIYLTNISYIFCYFSSPITHLLTLCYLCIASIYPYLYLSIIHNNLLISFLHAWLSKT